MIEQGTRETARTLRSRAEQIFAAFRDAGQQGVSAPTQSIILAGASMLILAVAATEAIVETPISLSLLYLLPVALVTWFVCRLAGVVFAFAAASATLLAVLAHSALPVLAFWNGGMRLGVLLVVVWLLAGVRGHTERQNQAVRDRTAQLEKEIADRKRAERDFFKLLQRQREQIAYDLHDDLAQVLTSLAMKTKYLEQDLRSGFSSHADVAGTIVKRMNEAVGQTRDIARGLCPIDADASEIVAAMRRLAAETAKDYGITCRSTSTHSQLGYSRDAAVHIYRIAQQAIDNAIRHGGATSIEIKLEQNEKQFRLTVADDGRGFEPREDATQGLGLRTMAFRADVIGGTFTIAPNVGGGACIEVTADLAGLLPSTADLALDTPLTGGRAA